MSEDRIDIGKLTHALEVCRAAVARSPKNYLYAERLSVEKAVREAEWFYDGKLRSDIESLYSAILTGKRWKK